MTKTSFVVGWSMTIALAVIVSALCLGILGSLDRTLAEEGAEDTAESSDHDVPRRVTLGSRTYDVRTREIECPLRDLHECGRCPLCEQTGVVRIPDEGTLLVVERAFDWVAYGYWSREYNDQARSALESLAPIAVMTLLEEWHTTRAFIARRRGYFVHSDTEGRPRDFVLDILQRMPRNAGVQGWCVAFLRKGRTEHEALEVLQLLGHVGDETVVPYVLAIRGVAGHVEGPRVDLTAFLLGNAPSLVDFLANADPRSAASALRSSTRMASVRARYGVRGEWPLASAAYQAAHRWATLEPNVDVRPSAEWKGLSDAARDFVESRAAKK